MNDAQLLQAIMQLVERVYDIQKPMDTRNFTDQDKLDMARSLGLLEAAIFMCGNPQDEEGNPLPPPGPIRRVVDTILHS